MHIDVVVAISLTALEFFKRHGEQIWPDARVVYQGFPGEEIGPAALPANATGVLAHNHVGGTVRPDDALRVAEAFEDVHDTVRSMKSSIPTRPLHAS